MQNCEITKNGRLKITPSSTSSKHDFDLYEENYYNIKGYVLHYFILIQYNVSLNKKTMTEFFVETIENHQQWN